MFTAIFAVVASWFTTDTVPCPYCLTGDYDPATGYCTGCL